MKNLRVFKTVHGENIFAELFVTTETSVLYLRRPIQVIQQLQMTPAGYYPVMVPMLYFPFGDTQTYSFVADMFASIIVPSEFDKRWYKNSLQILYNQETKRLLTTTAIFDEVEYDDKMIMAAPTTTQ